jgi:hypothetical protein
MLITPICRGKEKWARAGVRLAASAEHRPVGVTHLVQVGHQHRASGGHGLDARPFTQGEPQGLQRLGHVIGRAHRLPPVRVDHLYDRRAGHR